MDCEIAWHELLTDDVGAATRFYPEVTGWSVRWIVGGEGGFHVFHAGDDPVAAIIPEPRSPGGPPGEWLPYVSAADVDGLVAGAVGLGGAVRVEPVDVAGIGRFAIVADPQGASIGLFSPTGGRGPTCPPAARGRFSWHELRTVDPRAAADFHMRLFGWRDAGPDAKGAGRLLAARDGVPPFAVAVAALGPGERASCRWLPFVSVEGVADGAAAARRLGGSAADRSCATVDGRPAMELRDPMGIAFGIVDVGRRGCAGEDRDRGPDRFAMVTPERVAGAPDAESTDGRPYGGSRDGRDGAAGRTGDALALALAILEGPWTSAICRELLASVRSFGDIRRAIPGLSGNVLARRLRRLESDGVVVRIAGGGAGGTRGAYGLSPWGRSIAGAFGEIMAWGSAGLAEARGILKGMDDD